MSSFAYLKNLPVDFLKIDGALVRNIVDDAADFAMVEAITRVAGVLGLKTIAEFVETGATLDTLREIGVDYVQGYAIHRPAPPPAR
ncbi:MAG: EAL domain-containing protein [Hyphomicrobiaceae bacterium]